MAKLHQPSENQVAEVLKPHDQQSQCTVSMLAVSFAMQRRLNSPYSNGRENGKRYSVAFGLSETAS